MRYRLETFGDDEGRWAPAGWIVRDEVGREIAMVRVRQKFAAECCEPAEARMNAERIVDGLNMLHPAVEQWRAEHRGDQAGRGYLALGIALMALAAAGWAVAMWAGA